MLNAIVEIYSTYEQARKKTNNVLMETTSLDDLTNVRDLNTRQVHYSDPYCFSVNMNYHPLIPM